MPGCVPCPAAANEVSGAGAASGLVKEMCRQCCTGQPPVLKPCYKQPRIPQSYRPRRCYVPPTYPLENCTTYKLSYLPLDGCTGSLRGEVRKPPLNLVPSCEPMESCTVQKLSYLPNPLCVTHMIKPCHHDMWGQGPMQNVTTQRHDYVPKPCVARPSCKPTATYNCIEQPFENRTVNRLSYLNPGCADRPISYAPIRFYEKPAAQMECLTTQKMSYQPVQPQCPPQRPPWSNKESYQPPCTRVEGCTTYKLSYLPPGDDCTEVDDPCQYFDCKKCTPEDLFPRAACAS